jgi:DNA-binding NarL/FixJ family response regulator
MTAKARSKGKAQILVVEDHPLVCAGLMELIRNQPDLACCGTADTTGVAKGLVEQCQPDLMLLDLRLKSGDALDLIKSMRVEHPEVKVLVLSQYDELIFAERALRAGASGYIMKENATDEVLRAVRKVLAGDLYFSERVAAAVVQRTLRVLASNRCQTARCKSSNCLERHVARRRSRNSFISVGKPSTHTAKILSTSSTCRVRPNSNNLRANGPSRIWRRPSHGALAIRKMPGRPHSSRQSAQLPLRQRAKRLGRYYFVAC